MKNSHLYFLFVLIVIWIYSIVMNSYNDYTYIMSSIIYMLGIFTTIFTLINSDNDNKYKKIIKIIKIIFTIIFMLLWPYLAMLFIGLWALTIVPEWIFLSVIISYMIYYSIFWIYPLSNINKIKHIIVSILLNIFGTIWVFYIITWCIYRLYFFA